MQNPAARILDPAEAFSATCSYILICGAGLVFIVGYNLIGSLFRGIGNNLKRNFSGWNAWIIGPDTEDFDNIGLKPSLKIPLLNGSLECSLREYVLFNGRYNDFRADGGSVKDFDDDFRRDREPKKMRRVTDDEWRAESRKFGDHKQGRKPAGDKKSFRKENDRKPYARDERDDRKPFSRKDRGERKPFNRGPKPAFEVTGRGPRISADKSQVVNPVYFRSRKNKNTDDND